MFLNRLRYPNVIPMSCNMYSWLHPVKYCAGVLQNTYSSFLERQPSAYEQFSPEQWGHEPYIFVNQQHWRFSLDDYVLAVLNFLLLYIILCQTTSQSNSHHLQAFAKAKYLLV